jgi:hypothetical protein
LEYLASVAQISDDITKLSRVSTYGALHALPIKFGNPGCWDLPDSVKTEVAYSYPARSAAFAIWAPVEDRPAETSTSHAQSPSGQSLVVEGYFAC